MPAVNSETAYIQREIRLNTGGDSFTIHPLPITPGLTTSFSILRFSNDRKLLLSRSEPTQQLTSVSRRYLFDLDTGTLTRVRQPGLGSESVNRLSDQNSRLLGTGPKPFQITPDGTCIRLEALRIKNSPTDTPTAFGSLYPKAITPNHIASNGRITLTTTNAQNQTVILQIVPHNDANHNGLADDWEISYGVTDPDGDEDGDGLTNAEEFALGTNPKLVDRDGPDATPDDFDGDGVPNGADAAPWDSLIDWKASGMDRYAVIEMPAQLLSAAGQTDPRVIDIDAESNVLLGTRDITSNRQGGGFWNLRTNAFDPVSAVSVSYNDPTWNYLTRSSSGLCGMAGNALVHYASAPVDFNFGGALVAAPGEAAYGFWPTFRAINGEAYDAWPLGGDIRGITYCYVDNEGTNGSYGFPSALYLLDRPTGGEPTVTQAATFSDFENSNQHSLLAVTRQGWVAFHDQILNPANALSLVSPGTSGENGWIQDLPERSKASAFVALRAPVSAGGILIPDKNDAWQAPKAFEGQQIIAAMPNGVFINSRHELWTRDRRDKQTDPTNGNWLAPRHWAGATFADMIEDGWEPQYIPRASNSSGTFAVHLKKHGETSRVLLLLPVEVALHRRGTINAPGAAIPRPADNNDVYEVVTLENADFDEQTEWTPNSMASAGETNRQDGATEAVDLERDDDFVKIRLHAPLPQMPGSIELVMDQAGQGDRMQANDLRFYNDQGQRILLENLVISDLQNPQGPLEPMLQGDGLDLFVEIADLGQLTRAGNQATGNQRRYADLILRLTLGGQVTEQRARIYRGGYWRNQRNGNTGTIAFYDGKGRHQDQGGAWQVDVGNLVHGPFNIQSGTGTTDETVRGSGPTPVGWYGLWERTDFRTWWEGRARPQTDHTIGRNGQQLGYLQQGSYCQWSGPGNRTAYTHQGANPPSSVRFKFELVPWGHNAHGRTFLQIHPDGFNDGTAGCVGLQAYNDCCRVFFLLRHYFGTQLNVETP